MAIVPEDRVARLEFYEAHLTPFADHAAAVGLTPASVTALATATAQARAAYTAHLAAWDAARAATAAFYAGIRAMHDAPGMGADMIRQVKARARATNDPDVYVLAQIPAPALPTAAPAPGTPGNLTVGLLQDGSLELRWRCANPRGAGGTTYLVQRRTGGAGGAAEWTFLGASGAKKFVDATLPAGASPVSYQITAVRSTARGNPAQFTVHFGVGGAGGAAVAPRLAA